MISRRDRWIGIVLVVLAILVHALRFHATNISILGLGALPGCGWIGERVGRCWPRLPPTV